MCDDERFRRPSRFRHGLGALLLLVLAVCASEGASYVPPSDPRQVVDLSGAWLFYRGDPVGAQYSDIDESFFRTVTVPHTWNNLDGQDGGTYSVGTAWYRLHLTLPAGVETKRKYLVFDAAYRSVQVYINGALLGSHEGGFAAFSFDATALLASGSDQVIAVRVNNGTNTQVTPLSGDFTRGGGIYRPVRLIITDPVHISCTDLASPGVYLTPSAVSAVSADLGVKTKLVNDDTVERDITVTTDVVDADDNLVATISSLHTVPAGGALDAVQATTVANPRLWHGRTDPYCYRAHVSLSVDGVVRDVMTQSFGFRSFAIDPDTGFSLNGVPLDLHGANLHQDRIDKGWAISDADRAEDVALLQEIGATFVRLAHYQHSSVTHALLDRAGIVTWAELALIGSATDSVAFRDNAKLQLQEMIRQNYNHPGIIVWGMFNEVNSTPGINTLVPQLVALAHAEDATRPTTCAGFQGSELATPQSFSDVLGMNNYYGWYGGTAGQYGPWADNFHASRPTRAFGISEYGAGASIHQHQDNPGPPANTVTSLHSEEYQALYHEQFWNQLKVRPYLWHKAVWNLCDFASDARREGDSLGRNDKGLVTYDRRIRKDAFHWYRANWTTAPMVHITSRRYVWRPTATIDIKVYSNLPEVTLTLNGVSLGSRTSSDHRFIWTGVALAEGANVVNARAGSGATAVEDAVVWQRSSTQVATSIAVLPPHANVQVGASQQFQAVVLDQAGHPMATQPGGFLWNAEATPMYAHVARPTTTTLGTVTASALGLSGSATFQGVGMPSAPMIDSVLTATATVGVVFQYDITAQLAPTTFAAADLPPGLLIDPRTGVISGMPLEAGTFLIGLIAGNGGGSDSETLVLTVAPASIPGGGGSSPGGSGGGGGCGLGALAAALVWLSVLLLRWRR